MPPGSSWSDRGGFEIVPFDFERREEYVELLFERNSLKLAEQTATEAAAIADLAAFQGYFEGFLHALPSLVRTRLKPVVFRVKDAVGTHHWVVEPGRHLIEVSDAPPPGAVIFEVHAFVLNDCARLKMFSVWTASKRIRIHLPSAEALRDANLWFTLLDLYEVDALPIVKNFSLRALGVRLRRWREPVEVTAILFRRLFLKQRFSVSRVYPLGKA